MVENLCRPDGAGGRRSGVPEAASFRWRSTLATGYPVPPLCGSVIGFALSDWDQSA